MAQDKDGKVPRVESEVACYTREPGRPLLQRRLDEIGEGHGVSACDASRRDEGADRDRPDTSARDDRAG